MSTLTSNYNLVKPELSDPADITAMNGNWDTIDEKLKSAETSAATAIQNCTTLTSTVNAKAPMYTYSTVDLTAGTSSLETGKLYVVYE